MKVTIQQLLNSYEALTWLSTDNRSIAADRYGLARVMARVNEEIQLYEKTRIATLEKYGEEIENGYHIPLANRKANREEQAALLATECELPDFALPPGPILDDLTPARLMQLDWLLEPESGIAEDGEREP